MIELVPTILTNTQTNFNQFMESYKTFASRIQVDISDGLFTPLKTIDVSQVVKPTDYTGRLDIHMMVKEPSKYLEKLKLVKPDLVIFHAECSENLLPIFKELANSNIKTGVAILKTTCPKDIRQYIETVDHVLIFAGALGRQGGQADLLQLEKVKIIKSIDEKVEIGWDGGASLDNIRAIAHNGIDVINSGSAISSAKNPAEAYKQLEVEADKQGINL